MENAPRSQGGSKKQSAMLFWLQAGTRLRSPVFLLPLTHPLLALGRLEIGSFAGKGTMLKLWGVS